MRHLILLLTISLALFSFGQDSIVFHTGELEASIKLAKKEKKTVVIDFYADWCLPCKQMEKHTFSKPEVIAYFNERYIVHRIDMDQFSGMDVGDKYGVKTLPAILFLDKRGKERYRKIGFQSANEIIAPNG